MNKQTQETNTDAGVLEAVRDNLLKPMAVEICKKQEEQIEKISSKIIYLYILMIISLCLNAFAIYKSLFH